MGKAFASGRPDLYDYSVKQAKWQEGTGDVVRRFVASCRKAGVAPGIYCCTKPNLHCNVAHSGLVRSTAPADQARYVGVMERQLEELWGNYGPLSELWFDGGARLPEQGGPHLRPLLDKYQPKAMVFGSLQATIRWVGNESGVAPYPCWSTAATPEANGAGDPKGKYWRPGECDVPLRGDEWGWKPGQDHLVRSLGNLMKLYYRSVGRNCNLLLNCTPDTHGLVPEADMKRYREFGAEVQRRFGKSLAETSGKGTTVELALARPDWIDHVILMEQISEGERVRKYIVEGLVNDQWQELCKGSSIGHKRIQRFAPRRCPGSASASPHRSPSPSSASWRCTRWDRSSAASRISCIRSMKTAARA